MNFSVSRNAMTSVPPTLSGESSVPVAMTTPEMSLSTLSAGKDEDSYRLHSISPVLFGCVCALAFLGMALGTMFIVFNLKYRDHRLIKMSSPNLNVIIIVGTMLLYACAVLIGIDGHLTPAMSTMTILCKTQLFLLVFGFSLVYGSLFSKSWRVYRIFTHTRPKRMVIRDNQLVGIIACLLLVDAVIMALWLALDPPECKVLPLPETEQEPESVVNETVYEESTSVSTTPPRALTPPGVVVCHSRYHEVWVLVLYAYKALVLLYGTHLSWATRNVTLTAMNDARCIIISVYTCVILVSLSTAFSSTLWQWPNIWYCCLAVVILTCATQVSLLLHIPKIREWKNNTDLNISLSRTLTSSYIATNHGQSFTQIEEELFLLSTENASLKRALSEKDETIKMLQSHVGIAKEKLCQLVAEADGRHDSGCDFDGSSSASQDEPVSVGIEHNSSDKSSANKSPDVVTTSPRGSKQNSPLKKKKKGSPKKSRGTSTVSMPSVQDKEVTVIDLEDEVSVHKSNAGLELPETARSELDAQSLRRRRLRDRPSSARSLGSTASQFEELRKCIATELHQAHHLSSNLRDAIAQDLGSCRQRPYYYDMARTEEEILSTLSKSYRLRDDDEQSMSSSIFTYDNPVFSRDQHARRSNGSRRTSRTSRQSSFRSVASIALEIAESYSRKGGSLKERELQWPNYIPPKEPSVRSAGPPRVVRSSEAPVVYTRSIYNTYV